jgi:hypothetical protein
MTTSPRGAGATASAWHWRWPGTVGRPTASTLLFDRVIRGFNPRAPIHSIGPWRDAVNSAAFVTHGIDAS